MYKLVLILALILCSVGYANAQPLNIDFGAGSGTTTVPNTYGALGQVGCWNQINAMTGGVPVALGGLTGTSGACAALPGVTIASNANMIAFFDFGPPNGDAPSPLSPEQLMMDDLFDMGNTLQTLTINGLQAGQYNVIVYAGAPDSITFTTGTSVNGSAIQGVGGLWPHNPFSYVSGITHAVHSVNLGAGQPMVITYTPVVSFGSANGLQLVLVPEPGSLALLALGTLFLYRRRR